MTRLAVVLFNLGGPDSLDAVEPFLFNLFNDEAILSVPGPLRWVLAKILSRRRAVVARGIFEELGGKSPLLEGTEAQAEALQRALAGEADEVGVFIAMRYWHPMSEETARRVEAFAADEIVLLPLYPQYSTTTTGSSLKAWRRAASAANLTPPTRAVCCYPTEPGFVQGQAGLIAPAIAEARGHGRPRLLFSAHGLPRKIVARGDPYPWQVEQTCAAVAEALAIDGLDWVVCYQSRVGPLAWIGPSIDEELSRAAGDRVPVVVVPIAFVSEHSETLVELDIEYRDMAHERGIPAYIRVPALGVQEKFISGLARTVKTARRRRGGICTAMDGGRCPARETACPLAAT